ncbi:hypothetical protein DFH07DRAFT_737644 [Mycena maculata]|uniref:Uncharacterized protein n=1 Tax=Mycena maculata TaxID=230809 RepID=A0AAD7JMD4_9AGAR|nr:hypothetical protein DFH07DRAFT_737644 [Mycena maculata]
MLNRRCGRDDDDKNIDPALRSPSKRMRTLYAHLGSTSAGSLLLCSPKIKSYENPILPPVIQTAPSTVAKPNWLLSTPGTGNEPWKMRNQLQEENAVLRQQLALTHQNVMVRDQIIEEANATMVFQKIGLKKINEALHQQEEKAATDRAKLFKGKAQCLSSGEFYEAVKELDEGQKATEAGKEAKRIVRQRRKEQKEEIEREWAAMKERHIAAVETWSTECSQLLEKGAKKKDLPPKPKLGKKPVLPTVEDEEDEEEEEPIDDADV